MLHQIHTYVYQNKFEYFNLISISIRIAFYATALHIQQECIKVHLHVHVREVEYISIHLYIFDKQIKVL